MRPRPSQFRAIKLASAALLLVNTPAFAHVVSMSTGELRVDGVTASYELRIPMYEIAHVANPQTALLDHVSFARATRKSSNCAQEGDAYVCRADYEFSSPVDRVDATCTLFEITVPNHVHLLRATQGENADQAVFDRSFTSAEIRFRPPSTAERIAGQIGTGFKRAATSVAGALFLIALAAASRSWKEAAVLAVMLLLGEWLARSLAPRIPWPLSIRFIEAAMALTVAYLAVEMLMLPQAGQRWAIVFALGLFHGLYYAGFPQAYFIGVGLLQILAIAVLSALALRAPRSTQRYAAWGLLIAGLGWFTTRLFS